MKIEKTTFFKRENQETLPQRRSITQNIIKYNIDLKPIGTVFGLPQSVLEQPRLAQIKIPNKPKKSSFENYLENFDTDARQGQYYSRLKNTLQNRTKQLFRPLKKHNSVIDSIKVDDENIGKIQVKISKKAPISSEHSSQKALSILQKIIFKDVDFYANQKKTAIELQASRLPIIQNKQSKRKHSLAAYQAKFIRPHPPIIKYETLPAKSPRAVQKKHKQKPYFSGWDINQTNDF